MSEGQPNTWSSKASKPSNDDLSQQDYPMSGIQYPGTHGALRVVLRVVLCLACWNDSVIGASVASESVF